MISAVGFAKVVELLPPVGIIAGLLLGLYAVTPKTYPASAFDGLWATEQNTFCFASGKFQKFSPTSMELINNYKVVSFDDLVYIRETPEQLIIETHRRDENGEQMLLWTKWFDKKPGWLINGAFELTEHAVQMAKSAKLDKEMEDLPMYLKKMGNFRRC